MKIEEDLKYFAWWTDIDHIWLLGAFTDFDVAIYFLQSCLYIDRFKYDDVFTIVEI